MAIERILSSDSGKVAFEKTDRNMLAVDTTLGTINKQVTFTLTPNTGFVISRQDCYVMNGEFRITMLVARTDGGIITGKQTLTGASPIALPIAYVGSAMGLSTTWKEIIASCWVDATGVNIVTTSGAVTQIFLNITGRTTGFVTLSEEPISGL